MMNDFKLKLFQQFPGCLDSRVLLLGLFFTVYLKPKVNMTSFLLLLVSKNKKSNGEVVGEDE
jgi:hypothetical protein